MEEINAPDGYVIDTAPQTAYISGKDQDCITLTFTNSKNGALFIKKVDSVTGEPLSDVEFFVTTSDGTVVGNANGRFVTDSAGTILISDIAPGTTLVVKETKTREGYIPTRSDGYNLLTLINRYMDICRKNPKNIAARGRRARREAEESRDILLRRVGHHAAL